MNEPDGNLWVCVDCYFAHHYGVTEVDGEFFAGESDTPADCEPLHLTMGCELADNTNSNVEFGGDDYDESGMQDFSWSSCDGCNSTLGGSRYRLAYWVK